MTREKRTTYYGGSAIIHARVTAEAVTLHQAEARFAQEEFDKQREAERQKHLRKIERWRRSTGYLRG